MSTFGGASQRQGGRSNHMFRPPINITSSALTPDPTGQNIQFAWSNLTRQIDRGLTFTMNGTNFSGISVSSQEQSASFAVTGGNFVATYSAWTYYASNPAIRTLNSPNATQICPPLTPTLLPPSWNNPSPFGFTGSQSGRVYSGGGETRITYNAMPGTVTYNILKAGVPYLSNVTMPYTLTHTGANGTLAQYMIQAVGSAGGTSTGFWNIQPYNVSSGVYVASANAPGNGDQQASMQFVNNNLPGFGLNYLVTVMGVLMGECEYCGCTTQLTTLYSSAYSLVSSVTVFINTYYTRADSASLSYAYFNNFWYLITDQYGNGPFNEPIYYGSFGYYTLAYPC